MVDEGDIISSGRFCCQIAVQDAKTDNYIRLELFYLAGDFATVGEEQRNIVQPGDFNNAGADDGHPGVIIDFM